MFTKNQIDNWLELFKLSDNKDFKIQPMTDRAFYKRDLLEAKVQVDRWNVVTTDWIFHSSKKDLITSLFTEEKSISSNIKESLKFLIEHITNLELREELINTLKDDKFIEGMANAPPRKEFHIWGANVHFTDNISPHEAIGLSLNSEDNTLVSNDSDNITNSIVVFNVE